MNEVYEFLKKCGVYYLGTTDGNCPRVRPFGTVDLYKDNLYIQTGKIKDVSKQMHANPNIEICAMLGGEWIRVRAKAYAEDDREARVHMLDAYPELKAMYSPDDGNTEVFRLTDVYAEICSFTAPKKVFTF
ncbi:MAG: pyridoxamine 5'-phosphate oxidase family protein [Clostridia bacterium]|nr:pyridoxamine 5'-phosphate oxidase family protein [Clostridia bacterium]